MFALNIFLLLFGSIACQCPSDYSEHPVLLISMDGFRYDYLQRNLTPHILQFKNEGVSAPYMNPSYPSLTFPNHYTLVTVSAISTREILT